MKSYYIYILGIVLILASCDRHSPAWEKLQEVETCIEEHADSALLVLQDIRPENLSNEEEKAKHALLLSMAMDKNYIDRTDFEVLQPAIDYYQDHGTLRTSCVPIIIKDVSIRTRAIKTSPCKHSSMAGN